MTVTVLTAVIKNVIKEKCYVQDFKQLQCILYEEVENLVTDEEVKRKCFGTIIYLNEKEIMKWL